MCAANRAETFWASICDTPYDFPLRVLIVSLRRRPSPRLLGAAASASARHAVSASCARPGVHGSPCVLSTGRLAGKARLAWGRSRSYGVTLGTVSLSHRHAYLCRSCQLRRGYGPWVCLNVLVSRRGAGVWAVSAFGRLATVYLSALTGRWRSSSPVV